MNSTCDIKLTCDMVCDLAPLYKDGFASADSKAAIEKHLKGCPGCRLFYNKYSERKKAEKSKERQGKIGEYSALAAMISQRKRKERFIINATVYGVVGLSIALTVIGLISTHKD